MNLNFQNKTITLADAMSGKITENYLSELDRVVVKLIKKWESGTIEFTFRTSGSTGEPKEIVLTREQLSYSAEQTISHIFKNESPSHLGLALDPNLIGGAMVIIRALIAKADLTITSPTANPLAGHSETIDLISLVPYQIEAILESTPGKFDMVKNVLVGGSKLNSQLANKLRAYSNTAFYETYGMTETASHVALKGILDHSFILIGDLETTLDKRGCLGLKGTATGNQWIQTNDIVELAGNEFKWIGRADWVINSGGVKISPERIESLILEQFPNSEICISSKSDHFLGNKAVLVSTQPILDDLDVSVFPKYHAPKEEVIVNELPTTGNGKVDRLAVMKIVQKSARNA